MLCQRFTPLFVIKGLQAKIPFIAKVILMDADQNGIGVMIDDLHALRIYASGYMTTDGGQR